MEKKKTRTRKPATIKPTSNGLTAPNKIKILVTIVERNKSEYYIDLLEGFDVTFQTVIYGRGTAPTSLGFIGLGDQNKAIILSIIKEEKCKKILSTLEEKFNKIKNGKGIAYTIPISSVIGVMVYQFLTNNHESKKGI